MKHWHLPDLPTVGYSTHNQRAGTDAIMDFLRTIERDRVRLLQIVVDGRDKWRKVAGDIWRGSTIDTKAIDEMFRYLVLMAARAPDQRRLLDASKNADRYRDVVTDIMPDIEAQLEMVKRLQRWAP